MQGKATATVSDSPKALISASEVLTKLISGCHAQFNRKRGATEIVEFVSVDLERKCEFPRFGQDLTRLIQFEGAVFAEDIYKRQRKIRCVSLPPFLNGRKHRVADEISVALRIIFIFGCDGVRTEERDGKVERTFIFECNQRFQQAQLVAVCKP